MHCRELDTGVVEGQWSEASCGDTTWSPGSSLNISSTGPCILPLTASEDISANSAATSASSVSLWVTLITIVNVATWINAGEMSF